jgi:hypothetical protein
MFIYVGGGGSRTCQTSQAKYSDVQCIKLYVLLNRIMCSWPRSFYIYLPMQVLPFVVKDVNSILVGYEERSVQL